MAVRVCPWRNAYTFDNILRRIIHNPKKIVGPFVAERMTVVDIGCGMGFFSIAAARMVGAGGRVISVDIQKEMLEVLMRRAEKAGVAGRIRPHLSKPDEIGVEERAGFAFASWVVHEVEDKPGFMKQVFDILEPGGRFLMIEPWFHVSADGFKATSQVVLEAGFKPYGGRSPRVTGSRAAVFEKS